MLVHRFSILIFTLMACSSMLSGASVDDWIRTIEYHLLVKDYSQACECVSDAFKEYPDSSVLHRQLILIYANAGLEHEMLEVYKTYCQYNTDVWNDSRLLEDVSWCVLQGGVANSAPLTRLASLAGAASTRDARTYPFIRQGICDNCAIVRATACKAVGELRASEFVPILVRLGETDRSPLVKMSAIESLVLMKEVAAKPLILKISLHPDLSREERHVLAKYLALLEEDSPLQFFQQLAAAKDPSLRALAAEYAVYTRLTNGTPILFNLLNDQRWEVRAAALQALAVMWPEWSPEESHLVKIRQCAASNEGLLAVNGAWVLALCQPIEGLSKLRSLVDHFNPQVRLMAVAALCTVGKPGRVYLKQMVCSSDPYIKLNASLGLLRQRVDVEKHCLEVERILNSGIERLSVLNCGFLNVISESKHGGDAALPPELMDIAQRLEILQLLAILKAPCAYRMLESFLQSRAWGVSGMAAMLLLSEKNESSVDLVEELLSRGQSAQVRLQAALVLAIWSRSDAAVGPLHQSYTGAARETKERILNALGGIGAESSIPFLAEALHEPSSSLRIQAASALLRTLYR